MDLNEFNFDNLTAGANPFGEQKSSSVDERFYRLTKDDKGNGVAVIRFLPDANRKLMQQLYKINVNNQRGNDRRWVAEWSPQNIGAKDPFHETWQHYWNAGNRDEARKFARQERYLTNILVVRDPQNPENEGKVFLLEMSKSLKELVVDIIDPPKTQRDLGMVGKALFHPLDGYNFNLVSSRGANGFITYEKSHAAQEKSAAFASQEEAVSAIREKTYLLEDFLKPEVYKDYKELKEKLDYVMFREPANQAAAAAVANTQEVVDAATTAASPSQNPQNPQALVQAQIQAGQPVNQAALNTANNTVDNFLDNL